MDHLEFVKCLPCLIQSGSPTLCSSCVQNRAVITELKRKATRSADNDLLQASATICAALVRVWNSSQGISAAVEAVRIARAIMREIEKGESPGVQAAAKADEVLP